MAGPNTVLSIDESHTEALSLNAEFWNCVFRLNDLHDFVTSQDHESGWQKAFESYMIYRTSFLASYGG